MVEKKEKTIMEKLMEIQSKLKAPKGQENKFAHFWYRSCEDILEAVKPLLKEAEAILLLNDNIELIGDRHYVHAQAIFRANGDDIVTGAYAREPLTKKGMDEAQITGATSSYARKYALNGLFAIDDAKDTDNTNNGNSSPKDQMLEVVDKAFKEFTKAHQLYLEENDQVKLSEDKFIKAIQKQFGALPAKVESIPKIVEKIKLSDVIEEEFDAKIAEDKDADTPSQSDS